MVPFALEDASLSPDEGSILCRCCSVWGIVPPRMWAERVEWREKMGRGAEGGGGEKQRVLGERGEMRGRRRGS